MQSGARGGSSKSKSLEEHFVQRGCGGAVWAGKQPRGGLVLGRSPGKMGRTHARCVLGKASPKNGPNTNVSLRNVPQLFGRFVLME